MKNKVLALGLIFIAFIAGYFIGDASAINRVNEDVSTQVSQETSDSNPKEEPSEEPSEDKGKDEAPFKLEDVPLEITMREPDSTGTVYMDATFTNNTEYPITSYSAKTLLKDSNETGYLTIHDTVMPGEKSPKFDGFGPKTRKDEDYEILTTEIRVKSDEGKTLGVEHDLRLDKLEWFEYED